MEHLNILFKSHRDRDGDSGWWWRGVTNVSRVKNYVSLQSGCLSLFLSLTHMHTHTDTLHVV